MENNMVLEEGCIDEMLKCLDACDLVFYSTFGGVFWEVNDSLFMCRKKIIDLDIFFGKETCPLCAWSRTIRQKYAIKFCGDKILQTSIPIKGD